MFCAKRASWITASLGWMVVVETGVGAAGVSASRGTGEPSRDRLSGVWTPLEWADSTPEWLGEAGALLGGEKRQESQTKHDFQSKATQRCGSYLEESGPCGVLKHGTPRGLRFLKAWSMSLASDDGSILQKEPFPGSSCDRATLMKYRFRDRLWRIEFCKERKPKVRRRKGRRDPHGGQKPTCQPLSAVL